LLPPVLTYKHAGLYVEIRYDEIDAGPLARYRRR
jgi:hypothetical protein